MATILVLLNLRLNSQLCFSFFDILLSTMQFNGYIIALMQLSFFRCVSFLYCLTLRVSALLDVFRWHCYRFSELHGVRFLILILRL
jgi:hypothetical protein